LGPSVPLVQLPPVDDEAILREDAQREADGLPLRIGVRRDVLATVRDGLWHDVPGVGRIWVLDIQSPNAIGIRVHLVDMALPPGAGLIVYSLDDPTRLAGPFHLRGAHGHDRLWTPTRFGDTLRVEYLEPQSRLRDSSLVPFHIDQLQHVYFDPIGTLRDMDPCRIDLTCYPAWDEASHAVAGIGTIDDDSIWCTGTLVSNLASDFTPFFWTANHCLPDVESPENAEVYWIYQSQTPCADNPPSLPSVPQSAVLRMLSHGGFGFTGDYSLNLIERALPIYEVY
jgi:lysyl endopeptidase